MLKLKVLFMKTNIPTRLLSRLAKSTVDLSRLVDTLKSETATICPTLLLNVLFQLPSMPLTGQPTRVEFSATAKITLITQLPLSELPMVTGLSRIHGEPAGERMDSSDLQLGTLVESATGPTTLFNEILICL